MTRHIEYTVRYTSGAYAGQTSTRHIHAASLELATAFARRRGGCDAQGDYVMLLVSVVSAERDDAARDMVPA